MDAKHVTSVAAKLDRLSAAAAMHTDDLIDDARTHSH